MRPITLAMLAVLTVTTPLATTAATAAGPATVAPEPDDPYLWLEEVEGERAMAWVVERSQAAAAELEAVDVYQPIYDRILAIADSEDRIPSVSSRGGWYYNFWQDAAHERGLWRRTILASWRQSQPAWETVLDLDALAAVDDELWVFRGASCAPPDYRHCLVSLSRGGKDATVEREFDAVRKEFVADGFELPEAKSSTSWLDPDTLWVGTDFGEGSLSPAGYPLTVKLWRRGTPLSHAETVYTAEPTDIGAFASSIHTPEGRYDVITRYVDQLTTEPFLRLGKRLVRLDVPRDGILQGFFQDHLLLSLRSDLVVGETAYPKGALLAIELDALLRGHKSYEMLFEPTARISLASVTRTRSHLLVETLDNVHSRIHRYDLVDGAWQQSEIPLPGLGTAGVTDANLETDTWMFGYNDFLTPSSVYLVEDDAAPVKVKTSPAWFDAAGMRVEQLEATSADGTRVPYFVVYPKGFVADGTAPTTLYGYGGFENSELPSYSGMIGSAWLARGGVWVLANIRGGGEFGPAWHQAAIREHRQRAFDDFIAIAEDLIARKITSPAHLGIMGGSNGGLLVGAVMVQRPELFRAVVCQAPVLDMRRYHKLLAGASWMGEWGNPDDPDDWAYLAKYSPYHNLKPDVDYPRAFFSTSTRDDRVHPGHARKMVARMLAQGHDVLYWENTEGGHAAGSTNAQRAHMWALTFAYLWQMLG